MIFLFTDFGLEGPYIGQMKAALLRTAPQVPVFDLFADAPDRRPMEAAYLLAAYVESCPVGSHFLCVVDPGVGGDRPPAALWTGGSWFVGPGNGLFELVQRRAVHAESYRIEWRPETLSASFHGRDLFAPVMGWLASGASAGEAGLVPEGMPRFPDWPDDLAAVIYQDRYGNLMTGLRYTTIARSTRLRLGGVEMEWAETFSAVPAGKPFWYGNSSGLVEIAVNGGSAANSLKAGIGSRMEII
ncbi:MAG TPA: SAM-dependent chlorinase/fluorinase [Magnetospirillaceae bacterium]|nr:SAM-dependent chlorinase/fluorinase [Magnetospirillaceae bacterium]